MRTLLLGLICGALVYAAADPIAAVREGLKQLAVDSSETYRVRELEISKGGVKFYLSEGVLAFATPVNGQRIAAVYTTSPVEAGDAEVISFPPTAAERASLARFTKSPNMDEHFTSALLFFADSTAADLVRQIHEHPLHPAPELAADIGTTFNDSLRRSAAEIEVRVTQSILDHHIPANSFFYGMVTGRTLGSVDFVFQPEQPDKMIFGRVAKRESGGSYFQIWSAFRPAHTPEEPEPYHLSDYHIDTTIHADLSMTAAADFDYLADADDGAVISLFITQRLRATAATVDGKVAALMMHDSPRTTDEKGAVEFLISTGEPLTPGSHHRVHIDYGGSVIRRTANGAYFVDDRNAWYPLVMPMLTVFDLTFHCPENLRLVATGDPVSEVVQNGQRTVRRRTAQAQALAGFNLGEFKIATSERANYRIDICSNAQATVTPDLADQTGRILEYFTNRWMPLSGRTIAITPIEGYFGQGFPGLIYLSSMSYLKQKDRPEALRNTMLDSFFSQLLLPHELAHQWWGNVVTPADYRSNWIVEAMANYAALQYLEQAEGKPALEAILENYRADLSRPLAGGELADSYGPVTFDQRLENNFGSGIWHDILYEKGTWIFHMLRERMGDKGFHDFQVKILKDFVSQPISNEDLRQEAASFLPANQPDRQLTAFFDTWVYDTGIPVLAVKSGLLRVSGVAESYTVDVPLRCAGKSVWVRATEGESAVPVACSVPANNNFLFRN